MMFTGEVGAVFLRVSQEGSQQETINLQGETINLTSPGWFPFGSSFERNNIQEGGPLFWDDGRNPAPLGNQRLRPFLVGFHVGESNQKPWCDFWISRNHPQSVPRFSGLSPTTSEKQLYETGCPLLKIQVFFRVFLGKPGFPW